MARSARSAFALALIAAAGCYDLDALHGRLELVAGQLGGAGNTDGSGGSARFAMPYGITGDGAGTLYITEIGNSVVRKLELANNRVTVLAGNSRVSGYADGDAATARFGSPTAVVFDGTDSLYVADRDNDVIRKVLVATGDTTTIAGTGGIVGAIDGGGSQARFNHPEGLALDGNGNLYVSDRDNHTIRKIVLATYQVTTLAGVAGVAGSSGGTGNAARFNFPSGLAIEGQTLYVADTFNQTVRAINLLDSSVTTPVGLAGYAGANDGSTNAARFNFPHGLDTDGAGTLYVGDSGNSTLRRVALGTGVVSTIAGLPGTYGPTDGTGSAARFDSPAGVFVTGGELYVADTANQAIRKLHVASGNVTTIAGNRPVHGSVDGIGPSARFFGPQGLVNDGAGHLYVADALNRTIRKVTLDTNQVTTVAGVAGVDGLADGVGSAARLRYPYGFALDGGDLYFTDAVAHTVRKLSLATAQVTTLAGTAGRYGNADGIGTAASFALPTGLALDGKGNLYVGDTFNDTIRKIVLATQEVTVFAGSPSALGSADGVGTAAAFQLPLGLACDGDHLYVADQRNHTIRKIVLATAMVTTLAGAAGSAGDSEGIGAAARFTLPTQLALDGRGYLWVSQSTTLRRIALATANVTTAAGVPGRGAIVLGSLPAGLSGPAGMAAGSAGDLFLSDANENVLLHLH